ncbi:MAG: hypothetical protein ACRCW1_07505 [Anaerotignaceae bacterium]
MRNLSIEELKTLVAEVKNKEDKKSFYIILGVFVTVLAIAAGIIFALAKKQCSCNESEWEEWDEEYFDDDFEYNEAASKED